MTNIIDTEYRIKDIYLVVQSTMTHGHLYRKSKGRYSDCIVYVLKGNCTYYFLNNHSISVSEKDIFYLSKGSQYTMDITTATYSVIYIDFDFFSENEPLQSMIFPCRNSENLEHLFQELNRSWTTKQDKYITECFALLYQIYYHILRQSMSFHNITKKSNFLTPAITFLQKNYTNPDLTIRDLADTLQISEGHFRRLFKEAYSISPTDYIRKLRLRRAKELLKLSDCKISEIALLSGFNDIYYFSKIFKTEFSCSPSSYRTTFSQH